MFFAEIGSQPVRAAKTADAHRHALCDRAFGAAGKRQCDREILATDQLARKLPGFRRSAEDQDTVGHHAC